MGPWTLLAAAGLLEIVWALALKESDGFARLWPSVLGLAAATASFALLTAALARLPVGTAYAVWVGIGAVGVAIAGVLFAGDDLSLTRAGCLALIVAGVVGLRLMEG